MGKNKEEEGNAERKEGNQRKLALQEKEEVIISQASKVSQIRSLPSLG